LIVGYNLGQVPVDMQDKIDEKIKEISHFPGG
jgi:hypothetical protein